MAREKRQYYCITVNNTVYEYKSILANIIFFILTIDHLTWTGTGLSHLAEWHSFSRCPVALHKRKDKVRWSSSKFSMILEIFI